MTQSKAAQYDGVVRGFAAYWRIYGGWRALFGSPYFMASLVVTGLLWPLWLKADWWALSLSVLPGILSFSLGGFAILLAFGDETFRGLISGAMNGAEDKPSPYLSFAATFLHFILLQIIAILLALLAKGWFRVGVPFDWLSPANEILRPAFWAVGFWFFVYSLFAAIAAVMAIFVLVRAFDGYHTERRKAGSPD